MRRRNPHRVGWVNGMEWGLNTEDRRLEIGRGKVLQELRSWAVIRTGVPQRKRAGRRLHGTEQELPESIPGESVCRAEQSLFAVGSVLAAKRTIQLDRRLGCRRGTVSGCGTERRPGFRGQRLVATL